MPATKKTKILAADDDPQIRQLIKQILVNEGYDVVLVSNGHLVWERINLEKPDLVVLDIYMPGSTGVQICQKLKSDNKLRLIPVIILTVATKTQDKIEAIEAGADEFVNKPLRTLEFITRVRSLLKVKFLNDELDSAESVIFALARAVEAKDIYTQGHTERVSRLAGKLGKRLNLPENDLTALYQGGVLHDIGKIAIPDAILNKPGRLTEKEFEVIRTHPVRGEKICKPLNSVKDATHIIRHHHEKMDGSGYPDKLKGEKIPVVARIMAIVDVYDALVTKRSYRDKIIPEKALIILQDEAEKGFWDKKILSEFRQMIDGKNT